MQQSVEQAITERPKNFSPAIRAGILQLEAKRRERQRTNIECVRGCFDLIAEARLEAQGTLSKAELNREIPGLVLSPAFEFGWISYPRQRQVQRTRINSNALIPGAKVVYWQWVPIPAQELVENLGPFRVEAGFTAEFYRWLGGRPLYWESRTLIADVPCDNQELNQPGDIDGSTGRAAAGERGDLTKGRTDCGSFSISPDRLLDRESTPTQGTQIEASLIKSGTEQNSELGDKGNLSSVRGRRADSTLNYAVAQVVESLGRDCATYLLSSVKLWKESPFRCPTPASGAGWLVQPGRTFLMKIGRVWSKRLNTD